MKPTTHQKTICTIFFIIPNHFRSYLYWKEIMRSRVINQLLVVHFLLKANNNNSDEHAPALITHLYTLKQAKTLNQQNKTNQTKQTEQHQTTEPISLYWKIIIKNNSIAKFQLAILKRWPDCNYGMCDSGRHRHHLTMSNHVICVCWRQRPVCANWPRPRRKHLFRQLLRLP